MSVHSLVASGHVASASVERFRPPYVLTSDMLLVAALARTADLRREFAAVPFLSILGRTPLLVWFSRVTEAEYSNAAGQRTLEKSSSPEGIYAEVNFVCMVRRRSVFVPAIYASELRTVEIGRHYYGMPKQRAQTAFHIGEHYVERWLLDGAMRSWVRARLFGSGRYLASAIRRLIPRWTWPAHFPSGGHVRAQVLEVPRVQIATVRGQIAPQRGWLPRQVPCLPVGLYLPGLRMELPTPANWQE